MTPHTPYEIAGAYRRQEGWAITQIWKSNEALVNKMISGLLGQTAFNQDLAADVLEALLKYKGPLYTLDQITHFFNEVTKNKCLDFLRRNETRNKHESGIIYHYRSMDQDDIEIAEAIAHQQLLIRTEIAKIPGKKGEVFNLQFIRKLTETEIAERLGISEKTVRNHMSAAHKFLKMNKEDIRRRYEYSFIILLLIYVYEQL